MKSKLRKGDKVMLKGFSKASQNVCGGDPDSAPKKGSVGTVKWAAKGCVSVKYHGDKYWATLETDLKKVKKRR